MSRFKKDGGKKETPAISTASLPDIIFILLFFFMVVTVMREVEMKVQIKLPQGTELTEMQDKEALSYVYIGTPYEKYQEKYGDAPRIQLNDQFAYVDDIIPFCEEQKAEKREAVKKIFTVALKVDEETTMGIVTEVKQELRKGDFLRIMYSVLPEAEES